MTYKSFLSLFFVLILVKEVFSNCYTNPDNFCQATCQWNDETNVSLDISAIVTYPYTVSGVISDDNFRFIFTLCKGAVCDDATNAAICQHESNGKAYSCGIVETAIWSLISISPYKFTITYAGGACIAPEECKKGRLVFEEITDDGPSLIQLSNVIASTYVFNITGKCIGQPNCGADEINYVGPIGLVLIILAMVAFLVYLIVGVLVMKFYKGAQGRELIPNYTFWASLPFMIRDGCLLVISPCYKPKYKDYNEL